MASKTRTRKVRPSNDQIQAEALRNALNDRGAMNYEAIFEGFVEMGIAPSEITPRVNVFTYNAWRALGRQVRKGAHGVKVVTWITAKPKSAEDAQPASAANEQGEDYKFPRSVTVFHVSQTDFIQQATTSQAEPAETVSA